MTHGPPGSALLALSRAQLLQLAEQLERGTLQPPFPEQSGGRGLPPALRSRITQALQELESLGMSPAGQAAALKLLAAEREEGHDLSARAELVWTGPEAPGAASRDTAVVVRELFSTAQHSVLVACYALFQARRIFEPLAERMQKLPQLRVRMFLNIQRTGHEDASGVELQRRFVETFRREHWPGQRLPELFHDPRGLASAPGPRACLHAKCVIADARRVFVTSANFTEAAQHRNLEAGVLLDDPGLAASLAGQFESLVTRGVLRRVKGVG